jgi:hypothetical protein
MGAILHVQVTVDVDANRLGDLEPAQLRAALDALRAIVAVVQAVGGPIDLVTAGASENGHQAA